MKNAIAATLLSIALASTALAQSLAVHASQGFYAGTLQQAPSPKEQQCFKDYVAHPWYAITDDGRSVIDADIACSDSVRQSAEKRWDASPQNLKNTTSSTQNYAVSCSEDAAGIHCSDSHGNTADAYFDNK